MDIGKNFLEDIKNLHEELFPTHKGQVSYPNVQLRHNFEKE